MASILISEYSRQCKRKNAPSTRATATNLRKVLSVHWTGWVSARRGGCGEGLVTEEVRRGCREGLVTEEVRRGCGELCVQCSAVLAARITHRTLHRTQLCT